MPSYLGSYDGSLKNNARDGFGISYDIEGIPNYVGWWKNGVREGYGIVFANKGHGVLFRIGEGNFKNNVRDGEFYLYKGEGPFGNSEMTLWEMGEFKGACKAALKTPMKPRTWWEVETMYSGMSLHS